MTTSTVTRDGRSAAISLRSVRPDDRAFLLSVYASTREPELATVVDWDAAQKAAFVQMQFDAQHAYYQEHYVAPKPRVYHEPQYHAPREHYVPPSYGGQYNPRY